MRARSHVALHLAVLAAGALLGACGSGLYDATGVPKLAGGGGDTCRVGQIRCGPDSTCTAPSASACGAACTTCGDPGIPNGVAACIGSGDAGACGYECTNGFLKCAAGCCGTTALAAGDAFTCALLTNGEVACWGANEAGQVGDGTVTTPRPAPHLVALGGSATAIAAGASHACAAVGATVHCWGANDLGQAPATVSLPSAAVALAAGAKHTCALLDTGDVRCWGSNAVGQLGPAQPVVAGATAIAAGRDHACALVAGGAVRCWGSNLAGQLGAIPSGGISTPIPSGVEQLAAGSDQTCAGKLSTGTNPDDALRCWGDSVGAPWGLAPVQATPKIPMKDANTETVRYDVTLVAAGGHHVCVRKK
ncbi:MAG TPA: hypothetical protein VIW03_05860, partial [Anaeromyxobacter sp.]